jgi:hypothetical protein
MSTQNPRDQRRRDEESRVSASHLAQNPTSVEDDDEDWGDVAPKAATPRVAPTAPQPQQQQVKTDLDRELDEDEDEDEDDLERELTGKEDEDEEEREEVEVSETKEAPAAQQNQGPQLDTDFALKQLQQLESNIPALTSALETKLKGINEERQKLDKEEKNIKSRINFLRVLSGQTPLEDDEEERTPIVRRRGRRRASTTASSEGTASTTPQSSEEEDEEEGNEPQVGERPRGRGGRGKRFRNNQTLKQAIVKALMRMVHPESGKPFTGFVSDITQVVIKEEGYKSTSAKPTNTVRIQMYRLQEDQKVIPNEDGSYTLKKKVVREMGGDPDNPPTSSTSN